MRYVTALLHWRKDRALRHNFRRNIKETWAARSATAHGYIDYEKLAGIAEYFMNC